MGAFFPLGFCCESRTRPLYAVPEGKPQISYWTSISPPAAAAGTGSISRTNGGVFPSLVGGQSDRPTPVALRAYAPTSVTTTALPPMATARGFRRPLSHSSRVLRLLRRHASWPYRFAPRSPSFEYGISRRSP